MSDVVVSVTESTTTVTVTEQDVAVAVTENTVDVSASTAGIQGASYNQGDPIYEVVRNSTGATLLKGQIVYLSGATGNKVNVSLAIASGDATSARTIGWVAEDIVKNTDGLIMMFGYLEGIDTSAANAVGDILYLSPTVAGGWTSTKPQAPQHLVYVGVCVRKNASNGAVSVHIQNGYELDELHNVQITNEQNNDLIQYNSATDLWKNVQPSTLSVGTATYAVSAGTATYATTSGTAVYATTSGTAVYATNSGTAVNISGTVTQAQVTSLVSDLAGKANLTGGNALTGAQTITGTAIADKVLVVKGASGQTANLFEVQDSAASIRFRINQVGNATFVGNITSQNNATFTPASTATVPLTIQGAAGQSASFIEIQNSGNATLFRVNSSGFGVSPLGFIAGGAAQATNARNTFYTAGTANIGLVVQGTAAQSASLQEWQNSGGTAIASISSAGQLSVGIGGLSTISSAGIVRGVQVNTNSDLASMREENTGGVIRMTKGTAIMTNPSANQAKIYLRDGTTAGTLKLVVRAGAAGAETTILDNIPQ